MAKIETQEIDVMPTYSEDLPEDDDIISRIKLLSGMSEEVANGDGRPGEYYHEAFGSLGTRITLVPLGAAYVIDSVF